MIPSSGIVSATLPGSYNRPMNDPEPGPPQTPILHREPVLFARENSSGHRAGEKQDRSWMPWIVALVAICFGLGVVYWLGRPVVYSGSSVDPYAKNVVLGNVQVSQASNFAGDHLIYVDGTIENHGNRTITSMTLQASFPDQTGDAPQILQAPVSLIRSRDPYVDTQPISAAPLTMGQRKDFRLVFDNVSAMWNQQQPSLHIVDITTRP
jgi:hypothetical protein